MKIIENLATIKEMNKKASNIFLVAHRNMDLDAINSCIAFNYYLKESNKKIYIIVDDIKHETAVKMVLDEFNDVINFIKSKDLKDLVDNNSLLYVLDTNKEKLIQNPKVLDKFNNIIVIDHHRTNKESIKKALMIVDEEASSTCEIISSIFDYEQIEITKKIANLLLGGIVLDTNYYQLNVSEGTFYYSHYLVKNGASMKVVNEYLKQNIYKYINRQKIISSVKTKKNIAYAKGRKNIIYDKVEFAKTADILLTFKNIELAIVYGKIDKNKIGISCRSNGKINAGKIMEKFGGGGSEFEAAAEVIDLSLDEITKLINKVINDIKR